jgi:hypothetical protein
MAKELGPLDATFVPLQLLYWKRLQKDKFQSQYLKEFLEHESMRYTSTIMNFSNLMAYSTENNEVNTPIIKVVAKPWIGPEPKYAKTRISEPIPGSSSIKYSPKAFELTP